METVAAASICSMKVIPSIAFNEFSGSAGDVTARSVKGRTLLNHKAYQPKTKTPAQASSRNSLSKISRAYKQLTDSQMQSWEVLAKHLKGISTFGKAAELTAHNAFVRINTNRQMAGEDLLVDAPSYLSDIPEVNWESIWVTPSRVLLTGIANPTGTYKLVAKMSAGQGTGVTSGWSKTVVITPGMEDDWGDAGLTELYTEKIGYMPSIGEKVFIELYWLDPATGLVGETMRTTAICMSEAQAKEKGFTPRVQFLNDMFEDPPMNTELIIQILTLLLGGGGVIALFSITERKTKAQIENINLAINEWQKIVERCRAELKEARTSAKEFQDLYMVQFDINTKLRQELDEKNTRIAVLTLLRCKKLKCIERESPYGSEINEEIEQ